LIAAGALLIANWDTVKKWFSSFFDWLFAGFSEMAEWGGILGFGGGAPASAPSPQAQSAMGGSGQNVSQQTQIVVQGSGDPAATARAVSGQQDRVNADMTRNLRGAAR
jgi:hypothetical protein